MDQEKEKSGNVESEEMQQPAVVPYIVYEVAEQRHQVKEKRKDYIMVFLVALLFAANMIWLYVFQSYDYSTTAEYSGIYNLVDSEGNVISSDITPDDITKIMEILGNGKGQNHQN